MPVEPAQRAEPAGPRDIAEPRVRDFGKPALPWPVPAFRATKPVKLRCVAIEPRHLSLIALERGDCRYPYGGDGEGEEITFCGHPRRPGSSYCTPHFHLSRDPVEPPGRAMAAMTSMAERLKRLPRRHRIAHLRALIGLQRKDCDRLDELSELLRDEMSGAPVE